MYIRPQLSRKRTINLERLNAEHGFEMKVFDEVLEKGDSAVYLSDIIDQKIKELVGDSEFPDDSRLLIIDELRTLQEQIESFLTHNIIHEGEMINDSAKERLCEFKEALITISDKEDKIRRSIFETVVIDKEKIICSVASLEKEYSDSTEMAAEDINIREKRLREIRQTMRSNARRRI